MRHLQQMMALYPSLYRFSDTGPYDTRIIEEVPFRRGYDKHNWDFADDEQERLHDARHCAYLVRELAEWKAAARAHLSAGRLLEAIRATTIALHDYAELRKMLARVAALNEAERAAA